MTPWDTVTRVCPWCDYETSTVWPRRPMRLGVGWPSFKLGRHIRINHPHEAAMLFDLNSVEAMVEFYHAQPDLPEREDFAGLTVGEMADVVEGKSTIDSHEE